MKKTLKLMVMLLCVVSLTSLSSCSKDDTNNGNGGNGGGNSLLIGKWKIVDAVGSDNLFSDPSHYIGDIWEFKYVDYNGLGAGYQLYLEDGQHFPVDISENVLDMTAGFWGTYTIVRLTSDELELEAIDDGILFLSSISLIKL